MSRVALVLPGRGSYTEATMGALPADHPYLIAAEAFRAELGLDSLLSLDRAERFTPARHLRPAHVSALIYVATMLDVERAYAEHEVSCVLGNSMGWYTALAAAGALSFEEGLRLVQRMALLQEAHGSDGGQLIYPLVDERWAPVAARREAIDALLAEPEAGVLPSITLGGYAVLAGTREGLARAREALPPLQQGAARYPLRLAQHGPYHTPLVADTSQAAHAELADLELTEPHTTLIDGMGRRHTPWCADTATLLDYTLGAQVTEPYDFTASVRVALHEHAPERLVHTGPGNTLGGVIGQIAVGLGWRGLRSRDDFRALQASDQPLLISMGA